MAPMDPILGTAPVAGIAEPHQSTVAAILRAVGLGLFTVAEADMLIDRVRAHVVPVQTEQHTGTPQTMSRTRSNPRR